MSRTQSWGRRYRGRTVLVAGPDRWELVQSRFRDRLRAHWRALDLDEQLAAGRSPGADRLRAVRAGMLIAPAQRRRLAASWADLLAGSAGPAARRQPVGVPLQRARIDAARDDIQRLVDALRAPGPASARGVALANLLLTDGTSPVYQRNSPVDLPSALHAAVRHLDPLSAFTDS
jgi:hypothetical protein